jgi:hypothetical protein
LDLPPGAQFLFLATLATELGHNLAGMQNMISHRVPRTPQRSAGPLPLNQDVIISGWFGAQAGAVRRYSVREGPSLW